MRALPHYIWFLVRKYSVDLNNDYFSEYLYYSNLQNRIHLSQGLLSDVCIKRKMHACQSIC